MISKERLIAGLNELMHVEEGVITLYANFAKVLLKQITDMDEVKRGKIEKSINQLYRDSTKHREMLDNLIAGISKVRIDEY